MLLVLLSCSIESYSMLQSWYYYVFVPPCLCTLYPRSELPHPRSELPHPRSNLPHPWCHPRSKVAHILAKILFHLVGFVLVYMPLRLQNFSHINLALVVLFIGWGVFCNWGKQHLTMKHQWFVFLVDVNDWFVREEMSLWVGSKVVEA